MEKKVTYRFTSPDDIELLMSLRLEMLKIVNNLSDDYEYNPAFVENSRQYFLNGNQSTVVAMDGDRAIGCASMAYIDVMPTFDHPTGFRGHLMNVYTNPAYQRKGIGRAMVSMLMDEAREKGATEISLDATEMGKPLYAALGFELNGSAMNVCIKG